MPVGDLEDLVEVLADRRARPRRARRGRSAPAGWCAAAPASTPQVGWLTTSTPGLRIISRPTTNFCRLPPESAARLAGRACPCARRRPWLIAAATFAAPPSRPTPALTSARRSHGAVSTTFSRQREVGTRAAGRAAPPARRRRRAGGARRCRRGRPARRRCRIASGARPARSPDMASKSSDWPLPATPAMATISPPRTVERDVARARCRCGPSARATSSRSASRTGAVGVGAARAHLARIGADHQAREARGRSRCADRRSRPPCRGAGWSRAGRGASPLRAGARCRGPRSPRPRASPA